MKTHCTLLTCFADPLEIPLKGFREVLPHSQLPKSLPALDARSLVAKFPANGFSHCIKSPSPEFPAGGSTGCLKPQFRRHSPAQHTEHQVQHKERACKGKAVFKMYFVFIRIFYSLE
jgi:hypothetical protein